MRLLGRGGCFLQAIVGPGERFLGLGRFRMALLDELPRLGELPFALGMGVGGLGERAAVFVELFHQSLERAQLLAITQALAHLDEVGVGEFAGSLRLFHGRLRLLDGASGLGGGIEHGGDLLAGRQGVGDPSQFVDPAGGHVRIGPRCRLLGHELFDAGGTVFEGLQPGAGLLGEPASLLQPFAGLIDALALAGERFQGHRLPVEPALGGELGRIDLFEAEHTLEDLVAIGLRGLQEVAEPVLRQQHRSAERVEVHAEQMRDAFVDGAFHRDGLEHLGVGFVRGQVPELMTGLALALGRPYRLPDLSVDLERERDVRLGALLVDQGLGGRTDARRLAVERERDRIQDRGLPGTDGTHDAHQATITPIERGGTSVGAEALDRELTRTHRPLPRARRGTG